MSELPQFPESCCSLVNCFHMYNTLKILVYDKYKDRSQYFFEVFGDPMKFNIQLI